MFADRYELGASLGRGGMAEVFEAVAHGAHGFLRRVAIKRLLPAFADDSYLVRMFLDEARTASHLHHSKIVAVLDYGVVEGAPFQVLELVEGWDAARLARLAGERGQRIPVEVAILLATEVAHGLAYAHARKDEEGRPLGIVHRDVKPSNILVSKSGDIKLGDFGIALARERSAVTTDFVARGTPGFMSPEQLLGRDVGPAADIFGVGISLHGLLTGDSPLKGDAHRVLLSGSELTISADLPLDVREIIVRAVRVRPEERYGSAREMAGALGEALAPRLETDPTTRITQWLEELEANPPKTKRTTTAVIVPRAAPGQFALQAPTAPTTPNRPATDQMPAIVTPRGSGPLPPAPSNPANMTPRASGPPPPAPSNPVNVTPCASGPPPPAPSNPANTSFRPPAPPLSPRGVSLPPHLAARPGSPPGPAGRPRMILTVAALVPLGLAVLGLVVFLIVRSLGGR